MRALEIILNNLPFLTTIFIVIAAATVTYRSNRKSVESQNLLAEKARKSAHEDKISEFRHSWLQEVRNTSSELSKTLHDCRMYYTLKQREFDYSVQMSGTQTGNKEHLENYEKFESKYIQSRSEFYKLHSKIILLFKPSDSQTTSLMNLLNEVRTSLYDNPLQVDDDKLGLLLGELQIILKKEWETTKSRTWSKDT
jgi:hypothetical protein